MARKKKYNVTLSDDDVKKLKTIIRKDSSPKTIKCRCHILLDLDDAHGKPYTHEQAAKSNGVWIVTVTNTVKRYIREGLDSAVSLKRSMNSNNARRKLDDRAEARRIEIACTPAPAGHSRWTLRLLEEQAKIKLDTPVVCMDEKPYQLLGEPSEPLPMCPGDAQKIDSEYVRNGTCSIFAFIEPLGGKHHAGVREHRTATDWAEEIKYLSDVMYSDAEKIVLVMDNFNTRKAASLYKRYPAARSALDHKAA